MSSRTGYAEIATHYRQLIADGTLAPGDAMPSMREVCDQFGVSITTANRAFRLLKSENLTTPQPGVGTVVAERSHVAATAAARLKRIERTGRMYAPKERSIEHTAALLSVNDVEIADDLELELHDEIVVRTRVYLDGADKRTVFGSSFINVRGMNAVPELLRTERFGRFWQEIYTERTGRVTTRSPESRTARLATDFELERLGIQAPTGSAVPVLILRNVFHDDEGPLEVWEDVYAPGMWQVAD